MTQFSNTPRGTTGLTIDIPDDEDDDDLDGEDSVDLSDEESKGMTPTQKEMEKTRLAIRLMRSTTKNLAAGDSIDKEISRVLNDFYSH